MDAFYVSDLDGTLLRNDATLSPFTRDTLTELLAAGLDFTVASARSVVTIRELLDDLPLRLPVIEINGAFVSDLRTGRHESVAAMSPEVALTLYRLIREAGCVPFVTSTDGDEDHLWHAEILNGGMQWFLDDRRSAVDPRLRPVDDLERVLEEDVVCLTTIADLEVLTELEAAFREACGGEVQLHLFDSRYSVGWHWLTAHDRRATKEDAIATVRARYGLADRALVVFGDEMNDVGMFRAADEAIAVANAVDGLKPWATRTIGSNEDDAVAACLLETVARRGRA